MLRTNITRSISEVPTSWIFEFYCKLNIKLVGQTHKIKSLFNASDNDPSFVIFYSTEEGRYRFKDFSAGKSGNGVDLVMYLHKLPNLQIAVGRILVDYNSIDDKSKIAENITIVPKYKVTGSVARKWNTLDVKFWKQFYIGSDILKEYNVVPLESYTMTREDDDGVSHEFTVNHDHIYGYFRKDGRLYKIYQPKSKKKFLKVMNYIQGAEQLTYKRKILIIASSLKDVMDVRILFSNADSAAGDSENTLIPRNIMNSYLHKYEHVLVLLDNDDAGKLAMKQYEDIYGVKSVLFELDKDVSDACKNHGIDKSRETLAPLLRAAIKSKQ